MNGRLVQCFFVALALATVRADQLQVGNVYRCSVTDVDNRQLSIADGHVTIVTVVTRANQHDARVVGDRVPRQYYGDLNFRLITLVNLSGFPALRGMLLAFIRHRLDLEADRLKGIYQARGIARNARQDLYVVADFDGRSVAQFGVAADSKKTEVFLLAPDGRLVNRWSRLPSSNDLAAALQTAGLR